MNRDRQLAMFDDDAPPAPAPPRATGRQLRDVGMQRAAEHADAVHAEWKDRALSWFGTYIANRVGEFMTEDVRAFAEARGFPHPPDNRAWGQVATAACRRGLCRATRTASCKSPKGHAGPRNVYVACRALAEATS